MFDIDFCSCIALARLPTLAMGDEIVRYQLTDWKAKHIHDAKKADTITTDSEETWLRAETGPTQRSHRREVSMS